MSKQYVKKSPGVGIEIALKLVEQKPEFNLEVQRLRLQPSVVF
jgi:hypothetical protein